MRARCRTGSPSSYPSNYLPWLYYTLMGLRYQGYSSETPKTSSWQVWHIPEMLNSFHDRSSRKATFCASCPQVAQVSVRILSTRLRPVMDSKKESISGAFLLGFMRVLYHMGEGIQGENVGLFQFLSACGYWTYALRAGARMQFTSF